MALVMLGGLVGVLLGIIAPLLPSFLVAVVTGRGLDIPAALLGLMLLVSVPCGGVLGVLWAQRKTRR